MSAARLEIFAPYLLDNLSRAWAAGEAASLALAGRLARADFNVVDYPGDEQALLGYFGYALDAALAPALAGLMAAHDFDLTDLPTDLLRADPVYLRADVSRLILFDAETIGVEPEEADELLAALNSALGGDGVEFLRGSAPTRWYLRQPGGATTLNLASPRALLGTQVENSLAAIKQAGTLNRTLTEAQMVLHETAVNRAREARGQPTVNSLWFWGGGELPAPHNTLVTAVFGDDHLAGACARQRRLPWTSQMQSFGEALHADEPGQLLVVVSSRALDLENFHQQIFAPAWAALADGKLRQITLRTRVSRLELTRAASLRFWRRRATFIARVRALL